MDKISLNQFTPYEGGIGFAAKPLSEDEFIGKSVLKDQKRMGQNDVLWV